jgi:glycine/D-amino acid oxidase-like deaminating enzyme
MSKDLIRHLRSRAENMRLPTGDDYVTRLLDKAADEIERLRSALLSHMQREGQECDAFEKGRRAGLEEAEMRNHDEMTADHHAGYCFGLEEAAKAAQGVRAEHKSRLWFCDGDPARPTRLWTESSTYHAGRRDAAAAIRAKLENPNV